MGVRELQTCLRQETGEYSFIFKELQIIWKIFVNEQRHPLLPFHKIFLINLLFPKVNFIWHDKCFFSLPAA